MTVELAVGQRVEVARTAYGVATFDLGTVVDFPNEDTHVRVLLDAHADAGHPARIFERESVLPMPESVSRHVTRLLKALGAVSDGERAAVDAELRDQLMTESGLIDFARNVAARVESVSAAVRGLSL